MAEWLGRALQKLVQQFESARNLAYLDIKRITYCNPFIIMKHSQLIGVLASLAIIAICYMPWVFIAGNNILITGLDSGVTNFGRPGIMNIVLSVAGAIFFAVPKIWAKRTNVFVGTVNFAWAIRNYILLTTCQAGECPEKKAGLYLLLIITFIMLLMTFFPKIAIPEEKHDE